MNRSVDAQPRRATTAIQPHSRPLVVNRVIWPLLVATVMMVIGVIMRYPTAGYSGPPEQAPFNDYIFGQVGAYSDITSLYFRDQLWRHPVPYFDYYVEYPVGMGWLIWLIGFVNSGVMPYFFATAAVMLISGLLVIWLGSKFEEARLWLLALSPTLPLYVVLNWDMFGILLTVAALLLFRRERDAWGMLFLTAAVWTKFFPIVLVPLVVFDRLMRRRWWDAILNCGIFGIASVLINAPVALQRTAEGWQLRDTWLHFFRFNQERGSEVNFWTFFQSYQLTLQEINAYSTLLLAGGVGAIVYAMWRSYYEQGNRGRDLLLPASTAAIAWFFFINKVYSPQYSLWLAVFLALLAAPPALVVGFAAADIAYFAGSFIILYLAVTENPASGWFYNEALFPAMVFREAAVFAIVVYSIWHMFQRSRGNIRV